MSAETVRNATAPSLMASPSQIAVARAKKDSTMKGALKGVLKSAGGERSSKKKRVAFVDDVREGVNVKAPFGEVSPDGKEVVKNETDVSEDKS